MKEQQFHVFKYPNYPAPDVPCATWDRHSKYRVPGEESYPHGGTTASSQYTDRDSGYPGSTYRASMDDSACYDRDIVHTNGHRQHIYESPQFT